jgi:RNA polymerase sigma factor (sigma-70 family)
MHSLRSLSPTDFEAYDRVLRRVARRLCACHQFAEEIGQEVWLEAFRHPPPHLDNLSGWLHVAAVRTAARLRRREDSRRHRERVRARAEGCVPAEGQLDVESWRARILCAIAALQPQYREVVLLHFEPGLSGAQIAERLGRRQNTVRSQLRRGLAQLRRSVLLQSAHLESMG